MHEKAPIILCVDDSTDFLRMVEVLLARRGFRVLTATSGEEALKIFQRSRCAVAIIDYMMPRMKGGELAQRLRALDPKVPIILHTGYDDIEDPLLNNVDCTVPKGSFSFLLNKVNEVAAQRVKAIRAVRRKSRSKPSAA
jgi:two-component system, OmpR family, response regulator CpxR